MPMHYGNEEQQQGAAPPPGGGQAPGGGETAPVPQQGGHPSMNEDASERDQAAFDFYMDKIGNRLYSDEGVQATLKFVANQPNIATGIGKAAAMATVRADQQDKGQMPEDIVMGVADDTLERIAELAAEAKFFEGDDQTVEQAKRVLVAELAQHYDTEEAEVVEFMQSMGVDPSQAAAQAQGGQGGGEAAPPMEGQPPPAGGGQPPGLMGM